MGGGERGFGEGRLSTQSSQPFGQFFNDSPALLITHVTPTRNLIQRSPAAETPLAGLVQIAYVDAG